MADVRLATPNNPFQKVTVASGDVAVSFTALAPTTTKPATGTNKQSVIYDVTAPFAAANPSLITLMPWSLATNPTGVSMRVHRWVSYLNAAGTSTWWIPSCIWSGTLAFPTTAANAPTFGGSNPDGTQTYLFTGATSAGYGPSANLYSPASVLATETIPLALTIDPAGAQLLSIQFIAAANPAAMGVFWTGM
jgi:hypothetical protein